ncbi:hypothetical protein OPU71_10175 [Niveibacterium sp. 24ML]|uniref:glycine zipper 2TM domain-containing protein n=1 Tax=Niveibacterium sp. 24ML TaxID=2985512 RepID=UPI00226E15C5|nr:glycine zipper 2TM domain-containing protein [Niveibacterium sp. 24ML]MCX9156487.1 hypothetical protein [Niveibacterium sp. 24ML]
MIESLKPVDLKAQAGSTGKYAGAALGAALGGLGGSAVGHGKGKQAATLVGAAAGGAVGGSLGSDYDERASHTLGLEIVVKMSDGKLVSVIQAQNDSEKFERGQLVRVVHAQGGLHVSPY